MSLLTKVLKTMKTIYCKLAQIIVEIGGDVNAQDSSYKHTPLRHAAQQGSTRMATYLLTQKANPHMTTTDGQTPLQIAHSVMEGLRLLQYWNKHKWDLGRRKQ